MRLPLSLQMRGHTPVSSWTRFRNVHPLSPRVAPIPSQSSARTAAVTWGPNGAAEYRRLGKRVILPGEVAQAKHQSGVEHTLGYLFSPEVICATPSVALTMA